MLFNLLCSAWWFLLMWQMIVSLLLQIWSASCTLRKTSRSLLYKEILSVSSIGTFLGILLLSAFTHAVFFNWKSARSVPCRGLGSVPEGVGALQTFAWVGWLVCKVLVRLVFGAALAQVRELMCPWRWSWLSPMLLPYCASTATLKDPFPEAVVTLA